MPCAFRRADAVLLRSVDRRGSHGIADGVCVRRRTRCVARSARAGCRLEGAVACDGAHAPAGRSAGRAPVHPVSATRGPAVGRSRRHGSAHWSVRPHGSGDDQRAVAVRRGGLPRRFRRSATAAGAALLARAGLVALRRVRMERADEDSRGTARGRPEPRDRVHRHDGTEQPSVAVRAGAPRGSAAAADRGRHRGRRAVEKHRHTHRRPAIALQRTGHAGDPLHATLRDLRQLRGHRGVRRPRECADPAGQPANARVCGRAARTIRVASRVHRRRARLFPHAAIRLYAGPATAAG